MESSKAVQQPALYTELQAIAESLGVQNRELLTARQALEAERQRYHDLFDLAPDAYLITDRHGAIEEANRAAAELLGTRPGQLVGKPLAPYVSHDDVPGLFTRLQRLANGEVATLSWEMRLSPRVGETVEVAAHVARSGREHGEPVKLLWLIRDVTIRKQLERGREQLLVQVNSDRDTVQELARSLVADRDVLQTIMENTGTCLALFDTDYAIQRMNLACAHAWGCVDQELVECPPFRLHPEEDNRTLLARVIETGEPLSLRTGPLALDGRQDQGSTYWDWHLVPVKNVDGQVQGVVLSMQDVTEAVVTAAERERLLQASRQQREFLEELIEAAPLAIGVVRGPEHRFELVNSFFYNVPSRRDAPMLACRIDEVFAGATYVAHVVKVLDEVYRTGETVTVREFEVRAGPQRRQTYWDADCIPLRDPQGQVEGVLIVGHDVTEQVVGRERLRHQNTELRALTEELEAYDHTVAHDLKNPLTMITGAADLLNEALKAVDAPIPERLVRNILEGTGRMNDIVESLLLLASSRRHEVVPAALDMAHIVDATCRTLSSTVQRRGAELRTAASWPTVRGLAPWIESVWSNYLSNALKYGGEPPLIELGWSALHEDQPAGPSDDPALSPADLAAIRSKIQNPESQLLFWVRDHGPGLADEARARLFVEFVHPDRPNKLGHGLGLTIVRRLVETLGGQVGVESWPGDGCAFWFTLPAAN